MFAREYFILDDNDWLIQAAQEVAGYGNSKVILVGAY